MEIEPKISSDNEPEKKISTDNSLEEKSNSSKLQDQRRAYQQEAFKILWQTTLLIVIPALLAFYFGKKLDAHFETGRNFSFILSIVAIIFSWTLILWRYKKYNEQVKKVEDQIKADKNNSFDQ